MSFSGFFLLLPHWVCTFKKKKSQPSSLNQFGLPPLSDGASFHCILVFLVAVSQEISCFIRSSVPESSALAKAVEEFLSAVGINKKVNGKLFHGLPYVSGGPYENSLEGILCFRIPINLGEISSSFGFH